VRRALTLAATLILAACSGGASPAEVDDAAVTDRASVINLTTAEHLNSGTHRYTYAGVTETPACETAAEVGDSLTLILAFDGPQLVVEFISDNLPEGAEPGRNVYTEQLSPGLWRGAEGDDPHWVKTLEFTDNGIIMTSTRDGEPCLASVRDRID